MKKMVFISILTLGISTNLFAKLQNNDADKANIFLSYCSNFGSGVSYSFQSCINSNFSTVGSTLGGYLAYCANYGTDVSYSFVSCINSGFRETARLLDNKIFLPDCFNFDQKNLDYSFISCVNSNYSQITREVAQREN